MHLDPCEAAVDEPLIYQGWGKNQTYLLAFTDDDVLDVTATYTTDWPAAQKRRADTVDEILAALQEARTVIKKS